MRTLNRGPRRARKSALILLVVALMLLAWGVREGTAEDPGRAGLTIRVVGLKSDQGRVAIALFDSERNYKREADPFREAFVAIRGHRCEWEVGDIPAGEYAVLLYHDLNDNQRLDKNFFGIPQEPYGISNNPRPRFGTPAYDLAKFKVAGPTVIEVRLQGS